MNPATVLDGDVGDLDHHAPFAALAAVARFAAGLPKSRLVAAQLFEHDLPQPRARSASRAR